jgi:colicin import membrane protein
MAERRENSVLFSLKELRGIEDGRVQKEKDEANARAAAERASREAAERSAREAEERRLRDAEDQVRRIEEEREGKIREEQIRLQEAERRARVEGEVRIQEERMRLEVHHRAKNSPVKAVLTVAGILVLVAGLLGYRMYSGHQAELAAAAADRARIESEAKAAQVESDRKLAAMTKDLEAKLAKTTDEVERARLRAQYAQDRITALKEKDAAQHQRKSGSGSGKIEGAGPTPYKLVKKKDVGDNPLEGFQ